MDPGHLEVERKYAVDDEWEMPSFSAVDGVEEQSPVEYHLEAVYLDTARLDLVRSSTTLRRRTGGHDEGWHLKLPAGNDRVEVHAPLGHGTTPDDVPADLGALVRARTRGEPLNPVARLTSQRISRHLVARDGTVLAEVTDDHVTAELPPTEESDEPDVSTWREVEAELVDGDLALLDAVQEVLLASGAQESPGRSKLRRALAPRLDGDSPGVVGSESRRAADAVLDYVRAQLEEMATADTLLRRGEPEALHDLRVATRRLRSALRSFGPLLDSDATNRTRSELAWLGGVLGTARDAEVLRRRLVRSARQQPPELLLGPVVQRLDDELGTTERAARAEVMETLDGERYIALLKGLDALLASPPVTPRGEKERAKPMAKVVRRECRRVRRRVDALAHGDAGEERDHRLHEIRKAAKRARYAAELAAGSLGEDAKELAEAMESIQDALGEYQDSVVARSELRRLGVVAHLAGENGFTFGRLHALEEQRGESAAGRLGELWRDASAAAKHF